MGLSESRIKNMVALMDVSDGDDIEASLTFNEEDDHIRKQ